MGERLNHRRRLVAPLAIVFACLGCGGMVRPDDPAGRVGTTASPARFHGYIMSAQASTILVIDTRSNAIVARVKHSDLVRAANGKFHPNQKRFYASGVGKVTVWDTTDLERPVYLRTIIPAPGSTGEYRGVHVYGGSPAALDGDVYWSNIQDGKVYVYRAGDLEGANPMPVKVFDTATDGIVGPHYFLTRPGTNEIWLTLRTATASGKLVRINGDTRTIIATPAATLETTGLPGDEPTEFAFSRDGARAYVGHHGNTITGSPANSSAVVIVDATTFTVAKTLETAPGYATPAFVDFDWDLNRIYFTTKWSPALVVFDMKTERILRYIDLGGYGPAYGVYTTPDKKTLYLTLGPPAQGAVAVLDVKTLTITANIADTDLNQRRAVRFTHY
jgi:DNA-binding beta-propeller fold protein YncE